MKKTLSLILALVMCLSLCSCGADNDDNTDTEITTNAPETTLPETTLSKEDMLDSATTALAHTITYDIAGNKAKAKSYEGKTYRITGHIYEIEENYCLVIGMTVDGDNHSHIHSDDWYGFNCDTVFMVHLSTDELAGLNLCDGIEFVGVIDEVGTRQHHAIEDQIYLEFKSAYYIGSAEYAGDYRLD